MREKATFKKLFAASAILLAVLPFVVTFSAVLTEIFNSMKWYVWLQEVVVPFEARLAAVLLRIVGIPAIVTPGSTFAMLLVRPDESYLPVILSWNCLGWQSIVLLGLTLVTGLRGDWKVLSKIEAAVLGILGTFLINLFRIVGITTLMYYWNEVAARVIHDYVAAFVALVWLTFFWWFSYSFVLEENKTFDTQS